MYPLCTWGAEQTQQRLDSMLASELFPEVVVVSYQVIEQVVKRVLRSEMSERRVLVRKLDKTLCVDAAASRAELDQSLKRHAQSLHALQAVWTLVMHGTAHPNLPKLFDAICGNSSWTCLTSPKPFEPGKPTGIQLTKPTPKRAKPLLFGLAATRHRIVHSFNAIDSYTVRHLAPFGARVAGALIDPKIGIASKGLRDPLKKCFPFRSEQAV